MNRSRRARQRLRLGIALVALALVTYLGFDGRLVAAAWTTVAAVAVYLFAGRFSTHGMTSHWNAQERHVKEGLPIIYVRPGDPRCFLLRLVLGGHTGGAIWVDIWEDDHAAAFVRDLNDGEEIVPTVIMRNGDAIARPDPVMMTREVLERH